jgi:hypothetical protein
MSYRRAQSFILLSRLAVGAGVVMAAAVCDAADARVYRSGDFEKAHVDLASCPADALANRHPDLKLALGASPRGEVSMSGARSMSAGSVI